MPRRLLNLVAVFGLVATASFVAPTSVAAAGSGCTTSSVTTTFKIIKPDGGQDSTGWVKHTVHWCWNGEFVSIDPQIKSSSWAGGTESGTNNNHDLLLNQYDRSIEVDWDLSKVFCIFDLDVELWLDNDTGAVFRKVRSVSAHGTCSGWSLQVTSIGA